jgi:hypothetical protein
VDESITWPRAFSTTIRMSICPGGAANDTIAPEDVGAPTAGAGADVSAGAAPSPPAAGPTGPRNTELPSAPVTVSMTRAAASLVRASGDEPSGSQTNVTFAFPSGCRSVPVQNLAGSRPRFG